MDEGGLMGDGLKQQPGMIPGPAGANLKAGEGLENPGPAPGANLNAGEGLDKQWPPWQASGWGEAKSCVVLSVAFFCNFLA